MSVCDCDECPMSLPDIFSPRYCALGILNIDSCPHVPALKAVLENPDLVLVAVPKEPNYEFITRELEYWEDRLRDYYEKESHETPK